MLACLLDDTKDLNDWFEFCSKVCFSYIFDLKIYVTVQPFATGRLHLSNIFSSRERLRLIASVTVLSSKEPR